MSALVPIDITVTDIASPEAEPWDLAVDAWLASKRSPHTRRNYRSDADRWKRWCQTRDVDPFAAHRVTVDTWARAMEDADLRPKTIARRLSAIASLYKYLVSVRLLDHSPATEVVRPEVSADHSDTIALDSEQIRALIREARTAGPVVHVTVQLLLTMGLRSAELLTARVEDYQVDHHTPTLTVTRKGGKVMRLPMAPEVAADLDEMLAGRTTGPLIYGGSYPWLYRLIGRLGRRAGLPRPITPHCLRATFATTSLDERVPLANVQDYMGHADPRTTRAYDRGKGRLNRLSQVTNAVAKHIPRD